MKNQNRRAADEFNFVPETDSSGYDEAAAFEEQIANSYANHYLQAYRHENGRGDKRPYYPKEDSRGWIGVNQCDYFVMYSIPEDGGRTVVASIWVEDEYGKHIEHYDVGKLLSPILRHHISHRPASYGEERDDLDEDY